MKNRIEDQCAMTMPTNLDYNPIQDLRMQLEKSQAEVKQLEKELLELYRVVHQR